MPMDAMIIPLNARRSNSANATPGFDPDRHLAVEPPAWTVSLSDAAGGTQHSPALAAPFRLLSAEGIAAAAQALRQTPAMPPSKFLTDLARHPAVIDAVSALTGTCMVPAPCGTRPAEAVDLILSLSDAGAWAAGFAMLQNQGVVLRQTGTGPAAYTKLTFLPENAVIGIHDLEEGAGDLERARLAWVRHKTLISHRKLGRLLENFDPCCDRETLVHELWDAVSDAEHAIEALSSETESLDIFYET
jgi:hypothetical protein